MPVSPLTSFLNTSKTQGKFKKKRPPKKGPSAEKAAQMLDDGTANGKPLSDKQRKYFGYIIGKGQ